MSGFLSQLGDGAWALAAFVILLGVIITVHEWGHYAVARLCGVHVIRFSIGFGKALWSRTGRNGTEYAIAAIPLGGYVRMLDEREGEVPPERLHEAFNRQPVSRRFAIVAAGPLVNLLFAVAVYWVLFIAGSQQMAPIVGVVRDGSPAAQAGIRAGDEILSIDGMAVTSWDDVPLRLVARVGETGEIRFAVRRGLAGVETTLALPVTTFLRGEESRSPTAALGLQPWFPAVPPVLGRIVPEIDTGGGKKGPGPAAVAGLKAGDRVLAVDGKTLAGWEDWVDVVRSAPGRTLAVELERDGQRIVVALTPASVSQDGGEAVGVVGVAMAPLRWPEDWPAEYVRHVRYGPVDAIGRAVGETWDRSVLTVVSIGKMVSGAMSVDSIGGPISIARGAGATASLGPAVFLQFMAFLSISIGILNLLPIPVLDGGHLVFYAVEAARGKPVPERVQNAALQVGITLLVALMLLAFYNDFARLSG